MKNPAFVKPPMEFENPHDTQKNGQLACWRWSREKTGLHVRRRQ